MWDTNARLRRRAGDARHSRGAGLHHGLCGRRGGHQRGSRRRRCARSPNWNVLCFFYDSNVLGKLRVQGIIGLL